MLHYVHNHVRMIYYDQHPMSIDIMTNNRPFKDKCQHGSKQII